MGVPNSNDLPAIVFADMHKLNAENYLGDGVRVDISKADFNDFMGSIDRLSADGGLTMSVSPVGDWSVMKVSAVKKSTGSEIFVCGTVAEGSAGYLSGGIDGFLSAHEYQILEGAYFAGAMYLYSGLALAEKCGPAYMDIAMEGFRNELVSWGQLQLLESAKSDKAAH